MAELNVQQKNIVNQLRQAYPELKNYPDKQILSLYNQQLNNIQLSETERISIMNGRNGVADNGMGLKLETSQTSVSKEQEAQLKSALTARLNAVGTNVKKAEDSNGGIASLWSGIKNLTGWGDSSNKVREQQKADLKSIESGNIAEAFKQITGLDYTVENVNKFLNNEIQTKSETALNGYTEGQKMALDVGADMVSGILAVGALALAPVTGGASILIAAGVGAATKVTIKALAPGEYSMRDLAYDSITGSINGALAPITNGLGGAAGTAIAKAFGLEALESTAKTALSQAVKHAGKEVVEEVAEETVKQGGKSLLTRILAKQGSEYVLKEGAEKTLKTTVGKVTAYTADMMVDGSLSGAGDGFARALAEGRFEDIPEEMLNGFVGGLIASPFIGGGFRLVGKASSTVLNKINNKITFSSVLPDGTSTKFGQGQVGDCPLLSMIDGFLANDRTKGLLTNAIQTDVNGNFAVKIGDKTVTVLRSSLTDEMLADQSGIRIFEQAYKQIAGDLDGGFADVVAKHFGLNPLHITSDNITDEVLEKIANDSDNYVLSLGARINSDGVVTPDGEFQHYFSIKNIDTKTKTVTLVDTYDTSKTLTMSFDDVKTQGISIDGGSVGKTDLANNVRNADDVKFRGESEDIDEALNRLKTNLPEEDIDNIQAAIDCCGFEEPEFKEMVLKLINNKIKNVQNGFSFEAIDISGFIWNLNNISEINNISKEKLFSLISKLIEENISFDKINKFVNLSLDRRCIINETLISYINKGQNIYETLPLIFCSNITIKTGINPYVLPEFVCLVNMFSNIEDKTIVKFLLENTDFAKALSCWNIDYSDNDLITKLINVYNKNIEQINKTPEIMGVLDQYKMSENIQVISDEIAQKLENFLKKQIIPEEMIVYRGEDSGFVDSIILGDGTSLGSFLKKAKKSSQKELDKFVAENLDGILPNSSRFLSTSVNEDIARHFANKGNNELKIVWELKLPEGTNACAIDLFSKVYPHEAEILLQQNSSYFITKIENIDGIWYIGAIIIQ